MKRILSAALALCMVLSLSVTVFASPDTTLSGDESQAADGIKTTTGAAVNAGKIGGSISATIEWNDMSFVFDVAANKWRVSSPNGNRIVLTNNGSSTIFPKYEYVIASADVSDNSIALFDNKITTFTIGESAPNNSSHKLKEAGQNSVAYPSGSLGENAYQDFYLMFTGIEGLSKLGDLSNGGELQKVGTLHISIKTSEWQQQP